MDHAPQLVSFTTVYEGPQTSTVTTPPPPPPPSTTVARPSPQQATPQTLTTTRAETPDESPFLEKNVFFTISIIFVVLFVILEIRFQLANARVSSLERAHKLLRVSYSQHLDYLHNELGNDTYRPAVVQRRRYLPRFGGGRNVN